MRAKFDIEVENNFNIMVMALVTTRVDGVDFTPEQHAWIGAYSQGYGDAMQIVSDAVEAKLTSKSQLKRIAIQSETEGT